jgi:hypothetical protein
MVLMVVLLHLKSGSGPDSPYVATAVGFNVSGVELQAVDLDLDPLGGRLYVLVRLAAAGDHHFNNPPLLSPSPLSPLPRRDAT